MSNQEIYEAIEAYLSGNLKGTDLTDFEARLRSDSELAAQVLLFQDMDEALNDRPVLNFQKLVRSEGAAFIEKDQSEKATVRNIDWSRRYLAIAAALLVAVLSITVLWNIRSVPPSSGKELFAQNFETYTLNQSIRSEETTGDSAIQLGIQQYQANDYQAAAATFQELAANADQDMVIAFCLGNAYLNQQAPPLDLAEQQFQKIIREGESIYVPRAKWFMALIFLEKEEIKQAESLLQEVAKSQDNFGEKARALLKELDF